LSFTKEKKPTVMYAAKPFTRLIASLVAVSLFHIAGLAQSMVVVNNTPGVVADYKTLQGALDSVAPGTLILLQPGISTYGEVTVSKRVGIIGAGYFLNQNAEPNRQATPRESVVSLIVFDAGSNGSYITGISMTGNTNTGQNRFNFSNTSDITISRCLIHPGSNQWIAYMYRSSAVTIKQSYIRVPGGGGHAYILSSRESTGLQFFNNIFTSDGDGYGFILPTEYFSNYTASILFKNNVMHNVGNPIYYPSACTMINNIIFQTSSGYNQVNAVAASNNVGNATYSAAGPNIVNAVKTDVFVLNSDPSISSIDAAWKLKPGSAAIGYAQGGGDCGAFGGEPNERYELSGIAEFVPNIFYMNVPAVGTTNGGLPVHIKVRANQ
jgi:hypothetical protein